MAQENEHLFSSCSANLVLEERTHLTIAHKKESCLRAHLTHASCCFNQVTMTLCASMHIRDGDDQFVIWRNTGKQMLPVACCLNEFLRVNSVVDHVDFVRSEAISYQQFLANSFRVHQDPRGKLLNSPENLPSYRRIPPPAPQVPPTGNDDGNACQPRRRDCKQIRVQVVCVNDFKSPFADKGHQL